MLTIQDLFNLTHTQAGSMLAEYTYPHEALDRIGPFVTQLGKSLSPDAYEEREPGVWVARSAQVYPTATILPPTIIGEDTEVRPGAFIRGNVLVGKGCVVGNSTELKNVILFDGVQVPHYNYVGDSILGHMAHMGAGAVTSNVKGDKSPVVIRCGEEQLATGRKKVGAMLGDGAEIGCGAVLNPGTIVGRDAQVYPLSSVRGTVSPGCILKQNGDIVQKEPR